MAARGARWRFVVCAVLAVLCVDLAAAGTIMTGPFCFLENPVYGNTLPSCASRVGAAFPTTVALLSGPSSCDLHSVVPVSLRVEFSVSGQTLYNVALYLVLDGTGASAKGSCLATALDPVTNSIALVNTTSGVGPWRRLNSDSCGDVTASSTFVVNALNVRLHCEDVLGLGQPTLQALVTWQTGPTQICSNIFSVTPPTSPNGDCWFIKAAVPSVVVTLDQPTVRRCGCLDLHSHPVMQRCIGFDGQVNSHPCEPAFAARVRVSGLGYFLSQFSLLNATTLYANLYYDHSTEFPELSMTVLNPLFMPQAFFDARPPGARCARQWEQPFLTALASQRC